ncbi:MAG: calcium-binding protein, partial [Colwellia sp.]
KAGNDILLGGDGNDIVAGGEGNDTLSGGAGNDTLSGQSGDDNISGGEGNDRISGGSGNDTLDGDSGQDYVYGGDGDDTLRGGTGSGDYLQGDAGNDTYLFATGDGHTTIYNKDSTVNRNDVLRFLEGVEPSDVITTRSNFNLLLTLQSTGEIVTIQKYFESSDYQLNIIEFTDGTTWDVDFVKAQVLIPTEGDDYIVGYAENEALSGLGGNDVILGSGGDDILDGGDGRDEIYGGDGNDTLKGGAGNNDLLAGGEGSDTYLYDLSDGFTVINNYDISDGRIDTLKIITEGIHAEYTSIFRDQNDLNINLADGSKLIKVENYFVNDAEGGFQLDFIEFADGAVLDNAQIKLRVLKGTIGNDYLYGYRTDDVLEGGGGRDTLLGGDGKDLLDGGIGNDKLLGGNGDDVLDGGAGNDYLYGGLGADTYLYGIGYGTDRIYGENSNEGNAVRITDGLTLDDILIQRFNNSLLVRINGQSGDMLKVSNNFLNSQNRISRIEFDNGESVEINAEYIKGAYLEADASELEGIDGYFAAQNNLTGNASKIISNSTGALTGFYLSGTEFSDVIVGKRLNDTLSGREGDDIIIGGKGDDDLDGNEGNDTFVINQGDGHDYIRDYWGNNAIQFGEGIALSDITLGSTSSSFLVVNIGNDQSVEIFLPESYLFSFSGGDLYTHGELLAEFGISNEPDTPPDGGGSIDGEYDFENFPSPTTDEFPEISEAIIFDAETDEWSISFSDVVHDFFLYYGDFSDEMIPVMESYMQALYEFEPETGVFKTLFV